MKANQIYQLSVYTLIFFTSSLIWTTVLFKEDASTSLMYIPNSTFPFKLVESVAKGSSKLFSAVCWSILIFGHRVHGRSTCKKDQDILALRTMRKITFLSQFLPSRLVRSLQNFICDIMYWTLHLLKFDNIRCQLLAPNY